MNEFQQEISYANTVFPWQIEPEITEQEFEAWEMLRIMVNEARVGGFIPVSEQDVYLSLLTGMYQAGMRTPAHLTGAEMTIILHEVGES